jgi:glutamate racemase
LAEASHPFDLVFADTCVGGSTVAAELARTREGVRAFFLADYLVNPLGVKSDEAVREALDRWVDLAAGRSDTLVIACNTASVRLRGLSEVVERAGSLGLSVFSMADFLEQVLETRRQDVAGKRVCLMGTEFTVREPLYSDRILEAGARGLLPLAATLTERVIARLFHESPQGKAGILAECGETLAMADAVVLGCTCFPMASDLIRSVNPEIALLDPAEGISALGEVGRGEGPNRMTVALSGSVLSAAELESYFPTLFPGWELEEVMALEGAGTGDVIFS